MQILTPLHKDVNSPRQTEWLQLVIDLNDFVAAVQYSTSTDLSFMKQTKCPLSTVSLHSLNWHLMGKFMYMSVHTSDAYHRRILWLKIEKLDRILRDSETMTTLQTPSSLLFWSHFKRKILLNGHAWDTNIQCPPNVLGQNIRFHFNQTRKKTK